MRLEPGWAVRNLKGRERKAAYSVTGNVVWLSYPAKARDCRPADPISSLERNLMRLAGEIQRAERLKEDLAAAVDARRYELYRHSAKGAACATDRCLAAAQRTHVGTVLKFLHGVAAAGRDQGIEARAPAAKLDRLTRSIRELEASVLRARRLSQDVLTQCRDRDWKRVITTPEQPRH